MEASELMFWVDIESTGLEPRYHSMLEIAVVVTDADLNRLGALSAVVSWTGDISVLHPAVQEMHTKNGLFAECANALVNKIETVESMVLGFLEQYAPAGQVPLCGSTIAFDRSFLKLHMPKLEAFFHYRNYDVSVYTEEARRRYKDAYTARPQGKQHRAMGDILQSIELLAHWRGTVLR